MLTSASSLFWGKYLPKTGESLPLLAHALDVAVVFRTLCDLDGIRRTLVSSTKTLLTDEHLDRLAVLAMLHDIGKLNLGFQDKILPEYCSYRSYSGTDPSFGDEKLCRSFLASLPRK